ncbi:hypothetical protein PZ897_10555 [Hoeflea sp. YIM 152468]|uniref:hypothetical protein n=1 Tax=Hoeflea sp. YIM 152468 TaxID=3031759 RepID=UPI0023DA4806|nr:hypothetical protein [Hoeflea sp. YIM 152468]MDF1608617.1 hypothetical protein [Hoeflea sp. YIM 152468]
MTHSKRMAWVDIAKGVSIILVVMMYAGIVTLTERRLACACLVAAVLRGQDVVGFG